MRYFKKYYKKAVVLLLCIILMTGCANDENNVSSVDIEREATTENCSGDVDIDLTSMGSDMVYATVYQFMVNPGEYIGKTVKMEGTYYASYYDQIEQYYHYCIIKDAMQCCSQGMEFIWDDGSHVYPDDYPEDGTQIVVTGTFATYREEGSDSLYCCLRDSNMVIEE